MAYTMTVTQKPGYLHVKVAGDNVPETIASYLMEVRETCARLKCPVVLIEESLDGPALSSTEVFQLAAEGSRDTWPDVQRVAFVDTMPGRPFEQMKFAEDVAVNRGLEVRVFRTVGEAEAWLRASLERR